MSGAHNRGRGDGSGLPGHWLRNNDRGIGAPCSYLALANPPYYASFRIAEHFLVAGRQALRPGGEILVVTKQPNWYRENMPQWFDGVIDGERKGYHLFRGVRPQK